MSVKVTVEKPENDGTIPASEMNIEHPYEIVEWPGFGVVGEPFVMLSDRQGMTWLLRLKKLTLHVLTLRECETLRVRPLPVGTKIITEVTG